VVIQRITRLNPFVYISSGKSNSRNDTMPFVAVSILHARSGDGLRCLYINKFRYLLVVPILDANDSLFIELLFMYSLSSMKHILIFLIILVKEN
jgi:hypothetical protein